MAGATEAVAGHQQQVKFFGLVAESHCIRLQRFREHIEGAVGLDAGLAHLGQRIVEYVHIGFVHLQV